jgi:hypothetical protein
MSELLPSSYVAVRDLPEPLQSALKGLGFARQDIEVTVATRTDLSSHASHDFTQGFTVLVDLASGASHTERGDWGGTNMFNSSPVDSDQSLYTLPDHGAVIKGQRGGSWPVSARIIIPAAQAPKVLPSGLDEDAPTDLERNALSIFVGYKAFARPEYLGRAGVTATHLDSLVERGYLKRNRAGATSITTKGKNAVGSHRYN